MNHPIHKLLFLFAIFFLQFAFCNAQNLVPNPNFEEHIAYTNFINEVRYTIGWNNCSSSIPGSSCTPEYDNSYSTRSDSIKKPKFPNDTIKKPFLPRNSIYFELMGNSYSHEDNAVYSIDYERVIMRLKYFYIGARIGFAFFRRYVGGSSPVDHYSYLNCLINGQYQFSKYFSCELGIGFIREFDRLYYDSDYFNLMCGMRLTAKKGFMIRFSFVPVWFNSDSPKLYSNRWLIMPMPGLTIGWSFGKRR